MSSEPAVPYERIDVTIGIATIFIHRHFSDGRTIDFCAPLGLFLDAFTLAMNDEARNPGNIITRYKSLLERVSAT